MEKLIAWRERTLSEIVGNDSFPGGQRESDDVMTAINALIELTDPYTVD